MNLQGAFRALADPTRRDILSMLAERDMTIGEVADRFAMTRAAVKKHLVVLEAGELIDVRVEGRQRVNRLCPRALQQANDWLGAFSRFWDGRLADLRHAIDEEKERTMTDSITKTVFFDAAPELVWTYLTDREKLGRWYHPARADLVAGNDYELFRTRDDGETERLIWGRVLEAEAPRRLVQTFVIGLFQGAETTVTWSLEAVAGGTRLTLRHDGAAAAAADAPMTMLRSLDRGWDEHLGSLRECAKAD
ncbi:MAG: metalloregulator ArsR/SmtB family transcription factor [Pseudomonadota bacterium]